jgi:hypothetical protein
MEYLYILIHLFLAYLNLSFFCAIYAFQMVMGWTITDHVSLSLLFTTLTYNFYGFFGLIYFFISTFVLVLCGFMFWYEMSFNDCLGKLKEFVKEIEQKGTAEQTDQETDSFMINHRLEQFNLMKAEGIKMFYHHTGLNEERIAVYVAQYNKYSSKMNNGVEFVCRGVKQFRTATNEIAGLRECYAFYDRIINSVNMFVQGVLSLRTLHRLSRQSSGDLDKNTRGDPFAGLLGGMGQNGVGGMPDLAELERNLTPEQKQQMDKMAEQMLGSLFGGGGGGLDISKLMQSMGGQQIGGGGGQLRSSGKTNINKRK